jgi:hypothetical protein
VRYRRVRVIAGKGFAEDRFAETLRGITVDEAGRIYAVGDRDVKVFDHEGKLLRRWQTEQPGFCVALDGKGAVYTGEIGQVEEFTEAGDRSALWRDGDRLGFVTAIGFHGEYTFIADAKDRCIRRYDGNRQWLNNIGKDNRTKGFLIPNGQLDFRVDDQGIIHAVNPGKHRIERYSMDGTLLGHFGRFGTRKPEDFPGCCNPTNLVLTREGHVVVTEKAPPRVKVYTGDGSLLAVVASKEFDPICKNMDVAVDKQGRVYVADTVRLDIHVFSPLKPENEAATDRGGGQP